MRGGNQPTPHFLYINQQLTLTWVRGKFKIIKHHKIFNEINRLGGVETTPSLAGRLSRPRKTGLAGKERGTLLGKLKKFEAVPGPIKVQVLVKT
jgi:hypothetical protein